ncbi:hypothetical protein L291_1711 [Acinetobacter guillouiae MSP4-18]|uniref:hypothetical protein n=1 Tax=Acinetobacter guillouiae TaxID=106649 RepID=UPI0002CDD299|nr:hypothetical protein [Acinetobacter guillouiae]ENU57116.1 hypothetical protein F981_03790 [Acinetobacter guillouiae CIP 63.46]EPH36167.1 hypothetical protein L291_1711 [Acinetobacter guillouiae MSP4-18]KAB0624200.1 hypothetical protein F7P82_17980 [Acinetobacter guillouiae]
MAETSNINIKLIEKFDNFKTIFSGLKVNIHLSELEKKYDLDLKKINKRIPEDAKVIFLFFDKIKNAIDLNIEIISLTSYDNLFDNVHLDNNELNEFLKYLSVEFNNLNNTISLFQNSAILFTELIDSNDSTINYNFNINNRISELLKQSEALLFILEKICENLKKIILLVHSIKYKYQDVLENIYIERFKNESEILFKEFKISSSKILSGFVHESKRINSEFKAIESECEMFKKTITDFENQTDSLKLEYSHFDNRIKEITNTRTNDIQFLLEEKLRELEGINSTKIEEIDNSYQNAKSNFADFTKLVEMSGNHVLTDNYKKKSDEEKTSYNFYSWVTMGSIFLAILTTIIIIALPIYEFWEVVPQPDTNYFTILARLTISLMFFVLAVYASKLSAKHYECYQENHRTFLQLAALEPFMARMTPEEQKEIRKNLIPSYFNQANDGKYAAKSDEVDMSIVYTILDKVSNLVPGNKKQFNDDNNDSGTQK